MSVIIPTVLTTLMRRWVMSTATIGVDAHAVKASPNKTDTAPGISFLTTGWIIFRHA